MEIHFLKPDEYTIEDSGVIYTVLGSCIAIILWDKESKMSAMVHYRMVESKTIVSGKDLSNKMYEKILDLGIKKENLLAKVVGGKKVEGKMAKKIVDNNIDFAINFLKSKKIDIDELKIQYENALRIRFFTQTGELKIIEIV